MQKQITDDILVNSKRMNDVQQRVFMLYVGMGMDRSLPALLPICQKQEIDVTARQLSRWSAEFKWSNLAKLTQEELAKDLAETAKPALRELVRLDLDTLGTLKQRFHKRVKIDPFDKNLSEEDKALAIMPDLTDFEKIVNIERKILGDPTEDGSNKVDSRLAAQFDEVTITTTLKKRIQQIHNLPPLPTGDTIEGEATEIVKESA